MKAALSDDENLLTGCKWQAVEALVEAGYVW